RRLPAARAGPGVFEERGQELRALDVEPRQAGGIDVGDVQEEGVVLALGVAARARRRGARALRPSRGWPRACRPARTGCTGCRSAAPTPAPRGRGCTSPT